MPAHYDTPALYKATRRGWVPGPKVADPTTPLSRGTGARLVDPGDGPFLHDGRPGSWMEAADPEAARRVAEADEWRAEQDRVAKLKARADADGTAMLLAQLQAMQQRMDALEGAGRPKAGEAGKPPAKQ